MDGDELPRLLPTHGDTSNDPSFFTVVPASMPRDQAITQLKVSSAVAMSENKIAASKPKRRIGCSVISARSFGIEAEIEKARRLLAQCPVLRKIPTGLPHQPERRNGLAFARQVTVATA
jgi:hypothetical protein